MNDFQNLTLQRYSCRNFKPDPVSRQDVETVLRAACMAPSACNRQPWRFCIITNPETRAQMLAKSRPAFADAPVLIVAIGLHDQAWHRTSDGKDHTDIDVAIAVEHICLAATDMELATCWICSFDTDAVSRILHLGPAEEPVALIPLGYPADAEPPEKKRKSIHDIIQWMD